MAISQYGDEYYGLSGDDKPIGTPLNGRKFTEMDTSKEYRYDAENQQWLQQAGGGGSSTLSGLTDVDISNPTDGQTLVYNAETGKWENGAGGGGIYMLDLDNPDTITIDGQTYSQFWYNGVNWQFKLVDPSVISDFNLLTIKYVDSGITHIEAGSASVGTIPAQDPTSYSSDKIGNIADITVVILQDDRIVLLPSNASYAPGTRK